MSRPPDTGLDMSSDVTDLYTVAMAEKLDYSSVEEGGVEVFEIRADGGAVEVGDELFRSESSTCWTVYVYSECRWRCLSGQAVVVPSREIGQR